MKEDKAESGLTWGFELESIILEIMGNDEEISEEKLVDLLLPRKELQSLYADMIEFTQRIPEIRKRQGSHGNKNRGTLREEIRIFVEDISDGSWHSTINEGAHRKLTRISKGQDVYIKRVVDDNALR